MPSYYLCENDKQIYNENYIMYWLISCSLRSADVWEKLKIIYPSLHAERSRYTVGENDEWYKHHHQRYLETLSKCPA